MRHLAKLALVLTIALAGCDVPETAATGGKPLPKLYRINASETATIQYRMLDSVNSLRSAAGLGEVSQNSALNAAAATHSRDMALQNRPWHFGSDGSSPLDRVSRVGYQGLFLAENISETYETELETLSAWMSQPDTRDVIMDARADQMGFAWHQEASGKIWWTLIFGQAKTSGDAALDDLLGLSES